MISGLTSGLRILDLLVTEQRPWKLSEIAQMLSLSKSGLHGLLATLVDCGYVEHLPGGFYRLGFKAWQIGNSFPTADLVQAAAPIMERLVARVQEGAILGVLNGAEVSYVHLVESSQVVRVHASVGDRIAAHSTSTGLALLAYQGEDYLQRHLPEELSSSSSSTIADLEALKAELLRTRARGYSVNRGGWHDDVGGIAAPVMGTRGPIAALCVALPLFRMTKEWLLNVAPLVQQAAGEIEKLLTERVIESRVLR